MKKKNLCFQAIGSPEFLDLKPTDINPLMESCVIKVMYTGDNRNGSSFTKDVTAEMAKTLRGCPIVGVYKKDKEDFGDHGIEISLDEETYDFEFKCETVPYGFVAPNADVWFQEYKELDSSGNEIIRTYLLTNGYIWSGQFKEAKVISSEGRPQSMELDDTTISGSWAKKENSELEFFIVSDATFTKLCILGSDVEPCFEGSCLASEDKIDSFMFSANNFKTSIFSMMQDLKKTLEGGQTMNLNEIEEVVGETNVDETSPVETEFKKDEEEKEEDSETKSETEAKESDDEDKEKDQKKFAKCEDDDDEDKKEKDKYVKSDDEDKKESESEDKDEDEKEKEEKASTKHTYEELSAALTSLQEKYAALETSFAQVKKNYDDAIAEVESLKTYKNSIEKQEKEKMINHPKFSCLSVEDKAEVVSNMDKYTIKEIEAQLSVIYVNKLGSTEEVEEHEEETHDSFTFSLDEPVSGVPSWVQKILDKRNK